ncbi:MAG TPA: hypothetical protein VMW38_28965 [Terriglobia bacterium]|nr:hypothetical protein [Terriglobia bacterium]
MKWVVEESCPENTTERVETGIHACRKNHGWCNMTKTDTSEKGLGHVICTALTGHPCDPSRSDESHEGQAI